MTLRIFSFYCKQIMLSDKKCVMASKLLPLFNNIYGKISQFESL